MLRQSPRPVGRAHRHAHHDMAATLAGAAALIIAWSHDLSDARRRVLVPRPPDPPRSCGPGLGCAEIPSSRRSARTGATRTRRLCAGLSSTGLISDLRHPDRSHGCRTGRRRQRWLAIGPPRRPVNSWSGGGRRTRRGTFGTSPSPAVPPYELDGLHLGSQPCRWFNRFLDRSSTFGDHGYLHPDV
jgi:hypothetical protein